MSGIDSYRLYINSDYSGAFYPRKSFREAKRSIFNEAKWNPAMEIFISTDGSMIWKSRIGKKRLVRHTATKKGREERGEAFQKNVSLRCGIKKQQEP